MPQFRISRQHLSDDRFEIHGPEAHHLIHVLRKKAGEIVDLFDGEGQRFQGRITGIDHDRSVLSGRLVAENLAGAAPAVQIRLFQGLARAAKFDTILEKATEIGVAEIHPFISAKSVVRLEVDQAEEKGERWQRLVEAATKQCNRPAVPRIGAVKGLRELGPELKTGRTLVCWEKERDNTLKQALRDAPKAGALNLVVGPESGFLEDEVAWLVAQGAAPVSLGRQTLRTETAAIAALAILAYELDVL